MRAILPTSDSNHPIPRVGDLPDPVPGQGEILIAIEAAGINHADLHQLRGQYPPPPGESDVPGLECAGVVLEGEMGSPWQPGMRVMALLGGGGHATRVAIPTGQVISLPDNLSFVEGAAIPEAALTAWTNLVVEGGLQAGETVLVTGATGGMGSFAVQLARELGARVLAAGRSRERLELLRGLGIDEVCLEGANLAGQVREATGGRGVDLVLELAGGTDTASHLAALAPRGRLVVVGLMGGRKAELDFGLILGKRLHIIGSVLRARPREEKARLVAGFASFALPRLRDGRLRPVVDRVLPLERAAEAYQALERGGAFGKVVLSMV
ncbi:MAG TPA: NAD(P)H-quinone oxidoreductase [Thermoanaerobaculia bacterium]|jgi:putative PIG3 family NAD(P)H quinone oxidoreductase|nr:NAD(P)H-quinone oxidoreductase [Thermoanaerobaculia bacterium]